MLNLKKLKTSTALALTIGMGATGIAPIVLMGQATATPAPFKVAQLFPTNPSSPSTSYSRVRIPAGTVLRADYNQAEKIVVAPNERVKMTLTIPQNIRGYSGNRLVTLIPAGSQVEGEFQPVQNGTQFVANTLVLNDYSKTRLPLDARSDIVTRTEEIRRGVSTDAILKGAAIGSGAAAIISAITGDRRIKLGEVLLGTGAGALGGLLLGRNRSQVLVVNPRTDLGLRLDTSLALNPQ